MVRRRADRLLLRPGQGEGAVRRGRREAREPEPVAVVGDRHASPPFDDVRARQALAYAIDREAILDAAYYGQGRSRRRTTRSAR
ncbi:hypothetical protein CTI14_52860 [Methylobacterium radiotolerans]|nr:hypothetical protein CTI14_52860 [Methylobacterium radiotolerans]